MERVQSAVEEAWSLVDRAQVPGEGSQAPVGRARAWGPVEEAWSLVDRAQAPVEMAPAPVERA